ncbi:hypothetical protein A3A66_04745 [Microgenomates group bacterium RIFCSPLOWO2_01_FULL_46_13]|nr:MAG: hypothetical protein A3A66_04745 [Microgenomates group bacterium RIFCSPLOWO2_01_FULL_46_13]
MNPTIIWLLPLLVYIYPTLVGRALAVTGYQFRQRIAAERGSNFWLTVPFYFGLGTLTVLALALVSRYLIQDYLGLPFSQTFFPLVGLAGIISLLINIFRLAPNLGKIVKPVLAPVLITLILAQVTYGLWVYKSPYSLNWDWYQHQTLVRLIDKGQFSFFTSQMSDTFGFDSYPPSTHLLLAIAQYPERLTPNFVLEFWQALGFWHLITVGLAAWLLGWVVSHDKKVALASTIVSILAFDSMVSLTNFFFLPQTLAAVVFIAMLPKLLLARTSDVQAKTKLAGWETVTAVLSLSLIHYLVGIVAAVIFLGLDLYQRLTLRRPQAVSQWPLVSLAIAAIMAAFLASPLIKLEQLNQGEAANYTFSLGEKQEYLERSYGYLVYLFVPLGIAYAIIKKNKGQLISLFILFGLTALLITNLPYVLKLFALTKFFVGLFIALGFISLIEKINFRFIRAVAYAGLTFGLTIIFIVNIASWKAGLLSRDSYTHLGDEDIKAADFLYQTYQGRTLLISDPTTQFLLEGLSGVNSVGGAYMKPEKRQLLLTALDTQSPQALVKAARDLTDGLNADIDTRLLAISARTFIWADQPDSDRLSFKFNVWTQADLTIDNLKFLSEIAQEPSVKSVYSSNYIHLFEVR